MRSAYAVSQPVLNAYLVRERDQQRRRELILVLFVILTVGAGLIGYVWVHLQLLQIGYHVSRLEKELGRLTAIQRQLELESEYETSPQVVESRARSELGMAHRSLEQLIFVGEQP